ncbi:MAG: GAF domain-containing protein, partial [Chloroflexi bacterium]|nr:GAF domain-containing protein [Chloroflexota bacterium]
LRSILSVPLRIKKEVIGALHMLHEVADYFRPVDQTLLESLAASAAIAIDNARLFQENQQQTRQFQRLMDNVQDGILLLDAERRIKIVNLKAQAYLTALTNIDVGETLSQVGPHPLEAILNQADSDQWFEVKLSGSRTYTMQVAARNIAGETDLASWMILLRDVTGERAIQARVLQQERLAAVAQLT